MSTLLETMMGQLAQQQAGKIGAQLGLDEQTSKAAMQTALPAIMAAMARNSQSQQGAQSLNRALEKDHDGSLLGRADEFIASGDTSPGDAILKHVFGGQRATVEQAAAAEAGVKSDQMQKMMGLLAPMIMAQLGSQKKTGGFDAADLAGLIGGAAGGGSQAPAGGGLAGIAGQILGGALGGGQSAAPTGMGGIAGQIIARLGDSHFQRIGQQLGLSPAMTRTVVQMVLPMILAGLARNASKKDGAKSLYGALERDHDGSLLESDGFIVDSDPTEGGKILEHVFGPRRGAIEEGVAKTAGVDKSQIAKIMAVLAPIVLAELGRRRITQRQSPEDLARELQIERQQYAPIAPQPSRGRQAPQQADAGASPIGGLIGSLIDQDGDGDTTDDAMRIGAGILGRLFKGRGK
jgi:hypothetical protein